MSPPDTTPPVERPRQPAVAGTFYPADPDQLRREIDATYRHRLGPGSPPLASGIAPLALICPHAGIRYSGPIAANAYHQIGHPAAALLIGPNHGGRGAPLALAPDRAWISPLGPIQPASDLIAQLAASCPDLVIDGHAHEREHSLELQALYLRHALGEKARIAAIALFGTQRADLEHARELGRELAGLLVTSPTLLVASTDLSHYLPDAPTRRRDARALEAIEQLAIDELIDLVVAKEVTLCGAGAVVAVLEAATCLGASESKLLRYATSAETGGGLDAVVGYAALRIS